ncbi:MAG: TIGR04376 family protein [Cyanothece sp. SIO1E1]|nr:TIGR04376 family protein [Cyanothece sp. SIO1E1]
MGLFEDFSRFLETRLEEFLKSNPHLELQAIEEQLREQEEDTLRLMADLQRREKQLQDEILATAQEVQRWHVRVEKAKAANRLDLARPAEEREAALLRQGNQLWGQMKGVKDRIRQTQDLYRKVQVRRQEVKTKLAQAEAARATAKTETNWQTAGWNQPSIHSTYNAASDPLEATFQRWETDDELEQLKRSMGK